MEMDAKQQDFQSGSHLDRLLATFRILDGSRILLTGGTGFVGKWLLKAAKTAQETSPTKVELVLPSRQLSAAHTLSAIKIGCPNITWIEGDFLTGSLDFGHVDMIIHAATPASASLNHNRPDEMLRVNVQAMKSILAYSREAIPFLFTSSGAVYGTQPQSISHMAEGIFEPDSPIENLNAYAKGKRIAEQLCKDAGRLGDCSPIIARLFTFGGEYLPRDTHFAIGNFIQNCLKKEPILINGDGRSRRSYLYGADMATWLWSALAVNDNTVPLHIGSEHSRSIFELAQTVATVSFQLLGYKPEIIVSRAVNDSEPIHVYVPANLLTREKLDVSEWTSLEQTIRLTMMNAVA